MIKFNRILFTVLAFVLVLALASCGGEKLCEECVDKDGNGVCDVCKNEISTAKVPELVLFEDGEANFQIILPNDVTNEVKRAANSSIKDVLDDDLYF